MTLQFRAAALSAAAALIAVLSTALAAQWPTYRTPGVPRNPDGTVSLKAPTPRMPDGKPDFTGVWETIRGGTGQAIVCKDVPPLERTGTGVVDREHADDRLVFQPFARVALGGRGAGGQIGRRRRATVGERPVVAEPIAEVGGLDELGAEDGVEQALGDVVGGRTGGRRGNGAEGAGHGARLRSIDA